MFKHNVQVVYRNPQITSSQLNKQEERRDVGGASDHLLINKMILDEVREATVELYSPCGLITARP